MAYSKSEKAILKTIIYSDIFHSPVLKSDLWRFLLSDRKILKDDYEKVLPSDASSGSANLSSKIIYKDGMYCLVGREETIVRRKSNSSEVAKKMRLAKQASYVLSHIPTITCIGLSGGAAVGNVGADDDVDFFIITKKDTLFVTRFFILIVLEALGLRRKRTDPNPANKICVNFLIDEKALLWPVKSQDMYTAREIIQMKPLFERNDMYKKFFSRNSWIKSFSPNAEPYRVTFTEPKSYVSVSVLSAFLTLYPFEILMKVLQKGWMKRSRTREFISNHILAFHPHDYRRETLRKFDKKIKEFHIMR